MILLTPNKLIDYVISYDYEINIEQANKILELLDDSFGTFTSTNIEMATDYIVNGEESIFADYF